MSGGTKTPSLLRMWYSKRCEIKLQTVQPVKPSSGRLEDRDRAPAGPTITSQSTITNITPTPDCDKPLILTTNPIVTKGSEPINSTDLVSNDDCSGQHTECARSRGALYWRHRRNVRHEIVSACFPKGLHHSSDPRPYAQVKIVGRKIFGLLDSGASISCLGAGSLEFVESLGLKWSKIPSAVNTADGSAQNILGYINIPVEFKNKINIIKLYIVPSLSQELYLGVDFWKQFAIAPEIVSELNVQGTKLTSTSEPTSTASSNHDLALIDRERLQKIVDSFPSFASQGLGRTNLTEHTIDVGNSEPIKQRYYPVSPAVQQTIDCELERMRSMGVIEESSSPWSSPIVIVKKANGKARLCLDVRKLNAVTKKDAYPTPIVEGLLSRLTDTRYISSIDLKDAFWQIGLDDASKEKTAFSVPGHPLYQFRVMPFGLCNAPQRLCRLMDKVIPNEIRHRVFVYLDDLLIVSPDFETHLKLLAQVSENLRRANLTINVEKSKFCLNEIKYLGYIVGHACLKTDPDKVAAIVEYPQPKTVKQVRRFLGMTGWYRRFIARYAETSAPITDLLKKNREFKWTPEIQVSFDGLKHSLTSAPFLANPNFGKPFVIQCDASKTGIGGVLYQLTDDGREAPIAYTSQKLNDAQRNYSVTELECFAAVRSIKKFRQYVEGMPFKVVTDHASLQWLMSLKDLSGRLARWSLCLQGYDFTIEHRKGKLNVVPDALSRVYMEALNNQNPVELLTIDNSPFFKSDAYLNLIQRITENGNRLPDLRLVDGRVLKKQFNECDGMLSMEPVWKLWIPDELIETLIRHAHDPPSAAHCGIAKTLEKLRRHYYWPHMGRTVHRYITSCQVCKSVKAPNFTLRPPMGSQFVVERPWQRLYTDLIGPYPRSKHGNTYALIVLDQLTKFVLIKPLRSAIAKSITKFIEQDVFHIFGVPETIHSDNGPQYISREFRDLMNRYGVRHTLTAVYSPQSNASERVNRTILAAIRAYIHEDHREWDAHVSEIAGAIRNVVHGSTGYSPHFLVFGQHAINHASEYALLRKLNCFDSGDTTILPPIDRMDVVRSRVIKNLEKAHKRHAQTYNLRSRQHEFLPGQLALRRNFTLSNQANHYNAKLAPKFVPCTIVKKIGYCHYQINDATGKGLGTYHAKDLRPQ